MIKIKKVIKIIKKKIMKIKNQIEKINLLPY